MFTEGHVQSYRRPRRAEKSKDKGKRPIQRRIAKRKERVIGQHEEKNVVDEDSQESPTAKTCSSYEKKPARTKKIPKKTETASKTGANQKTYP